MANEVNTVKRCWRLMVDERIAVVADIHANIYALDVFLQHIEGFGDIDRIWNLGDFLQIGPHPREVAEVILNDSRIITVLGNNELALLQCKRNGFRAEEFAHQLWTLEQIGESAHAKLCTLPAFLVESAGGRDFLLVHSQDDAKKPRTTAVLCGHTHKQFRWVQDGVEYLNPGSLGASFKKATADFAIMEVSDTDTKIEFHSLGFDDSKLRADYETRRVPDSSYIMKMLRL